MEPADEILAFLDSQAVDLATFPDLNMVREIFVDPITHVYSDGERWAIVVEVSAWSSSGLNLQNHLWAYGDCLRGQEGLALATDVLHLDENEDQTWIALAGKAPEDLAGAQITFVVRGQEVAVPFDGVREVQWQVRSLPLSTRQLFLRTTQELSTIVPGDLPEVLRLTEWAQPLEFPTLASQSEHWRQLVQVAVTADAAQYRPTEPPTTGWEFWPNAGYLA